MRKKNRNAMPVADEQIKALLRKSGDNDYSVAIAAQRELAIAATDPIRQGILTGDIIGEYGIFAPVAFERGQDISYPLDFVVPGTESEYSAYTIPSIGRIPEKHIEGDMVRIPTYDVGASIDFSIDWAMDARWDIVTRALTVLENMFVRKMNSDAWRVLIAAGVDRNLLAYDSFAPAGFFTKRLISVMKTTMRRSGGGNLASVNQFKLTDIFMSPEGLEDVRTWDLTQIDDVTRRQVFLADNDGGLSNIFGVDIHELDELGENQTFQTYYTSLGASLASTDLELVIGLDLSNTNGETFIMPVKKGLEIFEDPTLHRQRRQGYYAWQNHGLGVLDNRKIIFGSF